MAVHVKAYTTEPETIYMEKDEPSIEEAIRTIRLTFNRETQEDKLFVEINGKQSLYDPWHLAFMQWYGAGWCQIHNPVFYFRT